MTKFDRRRPVIARTMAWQRDDDGYWERYFIREQQGGRPTIDKLTTVRPGVPVCMACLSNNVVIIGSEQYPDGELICHECGVRYGIVP